MARHRQGLGTDEPRLKPWLCSRWHVSAVAFGALGVVLATPSTAVAQSDGSLEQLYASQCADKQETQACRALIEAMSAVNAAPPPAIAQKDPITAPTTSGGDNVPMLEFGRLVGQSGVGDTKGPGGVRTTCYRLPFQTQHAYRIKVSVNRENSGAYVADSCKYFVATILQRSQGGPRDDKLILYRTHNAVRDRFLQINLFGRGKTYIVDMEVVASTPSELAAFDAEMLRAKEARRAAAQQKAAQASSGSGFFGALMASAGAVMAGGNTGQILGAASQGAQMANPGGGTASALGQVAGAVGAPQIDFQSALTGGMVGSPVGGAGGGSYPTKPNLALGACPGFTEGNYRTVALEPGNDVQRKTMCGQAFEYYTMYKRAIAQGYAEADANRTYAAHEGAVANLRSFVGN